MKPSIGPCRMRWSAWEGDGKLRPWLQDFSLGHTYGPEEVRTQIRAVEDLGLEEWLLWNPANRYTPAALKADE